MTQPPANQGGAKSGTLQHRAQRTGRFLLYALLFAIPFSTAAVEILFPLMLACWLIGWSPWRNDRGSVWGLASTQTLMLSLLLYVAVCTWSVTYSGFPYTSLEGLVGKTFEYALLLLLIADIAQDPSVVRKGLTVLLWASVAVCAYSLLQQTIGLELLKHGDHEMHRHTLLYGRMVGPFKNPNDLATYLMVVCAIALGRIISYPSKPPWPLIALAFTLAGCLAWTESRGALIGFFSGMLVLIAANAHRRRVWAASAAIAALILVTLIVGGVMPVKIFSFFSDAGAQERGVMWSTAYGMIRERPLLGMGINTFMSNYLHYVTGPNQGPSYAHNCFLQIAAETGLVGLGLFFWFLCSLTALPLASLRQLNKHPIYPSVASLLAALMAFLVKSAFDTNLYALRQAALFWTLAGLTVALSLCAPSPQRRPAE